jgi:hypothetical protein
MLVLRLGPAAACILWSISILIEGLPGKDTGLLNYNFAWLRGCLSVTKEKTLFSPPYPSEFFSALAVSPPRALFCRSHSPWWLHWHGSWTFDRDLPLYRPDIVHRASFWWNTDTAVLLCIQNADIKRCVRVFNTFILFSGGLGFKSRSHWGFMWFFSLPS